MSFLLFTLLDRHKSLVAHCLETCLSGSLVITLIKYEEFATSCENGEFATSCENEEFATSCENGEHTTFKNGEFATSCENDENAT